MKLVGAAVLSIVLSLSQFVGIAAVEPKPLELSVLTGRILLDKSDPDFQPTKQIAINVSGSQRAKLQIFMRDKVVTSAGTAITLPYGSTTNSLNEVLQIVPEVFNYRPNEAGTVQQFIVNLVVDPEKLVKPLQGEFLVKLTPTSKSGGEGFSVKNALAIGYTAVAVPTAGDLDTYDLKIENQSLSISKQDKTSFLDRLIPDLPGIINSGPVDIDFVSKNTGNLPLDKRSIVKIYRVNPVSVFNDEVGAPFYTINGEPKLILGGGTLNNTFSSIIKIDNGGDIDALPFIGFVRFEATAEGEIAGVAAEVENEALVEHYLVLPWKWISIALLLGPIYLVTRLRRRSKTIDG
jgi:hypothetical protein